VGLHLHATVLMLCSLRRQTEGSEFRPPGDIPANMKVLQTVLSIQAGQDPVVGETDHGTAVASKALGSRFGLAKKVSLLLDQVQRHERFRDVSTLDPLSSPP
jgi:hypothetical protein